MNINDFFLGQKLIAKETMWSRSHDVNYIPTILFIKDKEYEVTHVNNYGGPDNRYSISIKQEFWKESENYAIYPINDYYDCEFPFYTTQDLRDKKLEELGI